MLGTRSSTAILRRKQIDRTIAGLKGIASLAVPQRGWIAEARKIIGMRGDQLAARLRVSQPTISELERSEADGAITLNSLRRAASAMECHFVYAFVPLETSFEAIVRTRAERVAQDLLARVGHTMALEDQATSAGARADILQDYIEQLINDMPRELWDEQP